MTLLFTRVSICCTEKSSQYQVDTSAVQDEHHCRRGFEASNRMVAGPALVWILLPERVSLISLALSRQISAESIPHHRAFHGESLGEDLCSRVKKCNDVNYWLVLLGSNFEYTEDHRGLRLPSPLYPVKIDTAIWCWQTAKELKCSMTYFSRIMWYTACRSTFTSTYDRGASGLHQRSKRVSIVIAW